MKRVFVDTGAWYALTDRRDPDHEPVAAALREYRGRLLTSSFVLDETLTLVRYRLGWTIAQRLGAQLRTGSLARLERISPTDEGAAWTIFSTYSDQSFSFTDCTSFALCNRLKVPRCIAIDSDFRSVGLHCVPEGLGVP